MSQVKEQVVQSIPRYEYDLSHFSFQKGAIGSLMFHDVIPVIAGDVVQIDWRGIFRLAPLRHQLSVDAVVDLCVFYQPYRHVYNRGGATDWTDFIKQGTDESVTFGTYTSPAGNIGCLGLRVNTSTAVPRWMFITPVDIWNNYFRDPSDTSGILADNYFTAPGTDVYNNGLPCCHLKDFATTGVATTTDTSDYRLPLTDTNTTVDLINFQSLKGRLQTEQARDWFAISRYRDVLDYIWGSKANSDVDSIPTLIGRSTTWLSGIDVDGTDDATLGDFVSKAQQLCRVRVPQRYMPEHGTIWLSSLIRFPYIKDNQTHYLATKSQPTYKELAGDPGLVANEPPFQLNNTDIFIGASSVSLGYHPYAQWYRTHPNIVNMDYATIGGNPFISSDPTSRTDAIYVLPADYDAAFQTSQYKHWNSQSRIDVWKSSYLPDPTRSIFAGSR